MSDETIQPRSVSRRRFLRVSVAGVAGVTLAPLLAACGGAQPAPTAAPAKPAADAAKPAVDPAKAGPGGFAGGGSLKMLMRSHFVPAYDQWLDKWAADWGAKNRVEVAVDHILAGELPPKWAAEVASGSGHDMFGFTQGSAVNLYNQNLVDVSDVAQQFGEKYGGWVTPLAEHLGMFEGQWKGIPDYFIEFGGNYRKDLFDANNLQPVDTWDDLLKAGTVLKQQNHPVGIAINQRSNDANNSWNSLLWGYGASYVAADEKTVTINSPETKQAVELAIQLYKNTMTNEVLSWDDSANNQGQASGRISWIQNPISSLRTIEKQNPELAEKIYISNAPAGPKGRFASVSTSVWGVLSWSQNVPAAKAFLVDYYASFIEAVKASEGYNQPLLKQFRQKPMPIIGEDPKLQILQDFDQVARAAGYPGSPTVAAAEVEANWLIPLMIGQAVQSENADEAIKWAEGKIKAIYDKYK
jgi:multiple sugar transport system substrate-binding protein